MSLTMAFDGTAGKKSPNRTLPDGLIVLPLVSAPMTSSGERPNALSLSGLARITMLRAEPPNGGGAETPGRDENMGRTLKSA